MKKLLFLAVAAVSLSCANDGDEKNVCENKLWSLSENCPPENTVGDCSYYATYGETEATATTVSVNLSTYNYYVDGNTEDGSQCWEGTK